MASIDLDQLLNLEERFSAVGHADGIRDGEQLGLIEGRSLGRQKGLELGLELGYYMAFAEYWLKQVEIDPSRYVSRASKQLASLHSALEAFPTENRLNVDALALLDRIRAKFKTVSTILGTHRVQSYTEISTASTLTY